MGESVTGNSSEYVAVPFGDTCWRQLLPDFCPALNDEQIQAALAPYEAAHIAAYNDYIFVIGHRPSDLVSVTFNPSRLPLSKGTATAARGSGRRQSSSATLPISPCFDSLMRFCSRTLTWSKQPLLGDAPPLRLTNYAFCYDSSIGKAYLHGGYLGKSYDPPVFAGGVDETEGQISNIVFELNLVTLTWRRLLPISAADVVDSSQKNLGNELVLKQLLEVGDNHTNTTCGGVTSGAILDAGIADTAVAPSPVKSLLPAVSPPLRFSHTICLHDGKLYLFGGLSIPAATLPPNERSTAVDINIPKLHNDVYSFDVGKLQWERLETTGPNPTARQAHTADLYRRYGKPAQMIIHGGSTPHQLLNDVFALDLKTMQWREMKRDTLAAQALVQYNVNNDTSASMHMIAPVGRSRHRMAIIGCKMFVLGGIRLKTRAELDADLHSINMDQIDRMTRYLPINELAVFDLEKRVWSVSTPTTYARSRLPAIISPPSELVTTNAPECSAGAVAFTANESGQVVVLSEPKKRLYGESNKWPVCDDFSHIPCIDLIQHNCRLYAMCGPELDRHFFQADIGRPPAPPQLRYLSITYDNVEIEWNSVPNADEYLIQLQLLAIDDSSPLYQKASSSSTTTHPHLSLNYTGQSPQQQHLLTLSPAPHGLLNQQHHNVGEEMPPVWNEQQLPTAFAAPTQMQQPSHAIISSQPASPHRATPLQSVSSGLPFLSQLSLIPPATIDRIPHYLRPKLDSELVDADSCIGLELTADNHMQSIDDSIAYAQLTTPTAPVASFNLPTRPASPWFDVAIVERASNTFVVDSYLVPDAPTRMAPPFTENVPDYRTGTVLTRVYGLYGIGTLSLTRLFQNLMVKLRVCAINGCGRSIFSNEVQIKTYLRGLPPPPHNVQVKWTNDNGCLISWNEVTENGPIKDYSVFLMQKPDYENAGNNLDSTPKAVAVYEGSKTSAVISREQLALAYIENVNGEPAITFRVSSRNESSLGGQAVQVRWLYAAPPGAGALGSLPHNVADLNHNQFSSPSKQQHASAAAARHSNSGRHHASLQQHHHQKAHVKKMTSGGGAAAAGTVQQQPVFVHRSQLGDSGAVRLSSPVTVAADNSDTWHASQHIMHAANVLPAGDSVEQQQQQHLNQHRFLPVSTVASGHAFASAAPPRRLTSLFPVVSPAFVDAAAPPFPVPQRPPVTLKSPSPAFTDMHQADALLMTPAGDGGFSVQPPPFMPQKSNEKKKKTTVVRPVPKPATQQFAGSGEDFR